MKNAKSVAAALVVIALVIGGAGGYYLGMSKAAAMADAATKNRIKQLEADWMKTQGFGAEVGTPKPAVTSIGGRVTTVGEDYIEIETSTANTNPFAEPLPAKRRVTLAAGGKVILVSRKSADEMKKEMAAYEVARKQMEKDLQAGKNPELIGVPSAEKTTEIAIKDIPEGVGVQVTADQDIEYAQTIEAKEITLYEAIPPEELTPGGPQPPAPSPTGPVPSPASPVLP